MASYSNLRGAATAWTCSKIQICTLALLYERLGGVSMR